MATQEDAVPKTKLTGRILLVDDEPAILRSLGLYLERNGVTVVTAADATQALDHLEQDTFDLLISDVNLPGSSGTEMLEVVRRRWPALPFLIITGSLEPAAAVEALLGGPDRFLLKPFDLSELARKVATALSR